LAARPLALLSIALLACPEKRGADIAKLVEGTQIVERNREPAAEWTPSKTGETYAIGDAVRTGPASRAQLELVGGGGLRLGERALVRFGRGDQRIGLAMGEALVEAAGAPVAVSTGKGQVVVSPDAKVRFSATEGVIHFDVLVGSATIEQGGTTRAVSAGQGFDVAIGGAVIEGKPDAGVPDAAVPDAGVDAAQAPVAGVVKALLKGRGAQARDTESAPWRTLAAGEVDLVPGAQVKLGPRATVELSRGDEKSIVRGAAELAIGPAGGALATVQRGAVVVLATTTPTRVDLAGGSVTARKAGGAGSRAEMSVVRKRDTQVSVRAGLVEIKGRGMLETLGSGETAALTGGGDIRFAGKAPDYADFSLPAGESAVIHDPNPPTAVRIKLAGQCPKAAIVEISRRGRWDRPDGVSRGESAANVLIPRGAMQYRVRCLTDEQAEEQPKARGTLNVLADRGVAPIPKRAPKNVVDADGRKYTVLYQNLLPQLTFRWRQPPAGDVQLKITNGKAPEQVMPAPGAQIVVESGALQEGNYQYWFEATADARIRSPKTTLVIDFDNAAPTASLKEPPATGFSATPVKVSGVVLEGWSVSVGGTGLKSDARLRFSGEVTPAGDERAIAIRFVHPARGVHYYLRRRSP
jgi:hypothetical protein